MNKNLVMSTESEEKRSSMPEKRSSKKRKRDHEADTSSHASKIKPSEEGATGGSTESYELFYTIESPYSQFYPTKFTVDGKTFSCAEQFMMYSKAMLFKDDSIAKDILKETVPKKMKAFGRKVSNFDDKVWVSKREEIVKKGSIAKFSQNEELKKQLFSTYPKILAEASPRDCIWGIGLGVNNPKALDKKTWRGKNLLGYILTDVRDELMQKEKKSADSAEKS